MHKITSFWRNSAHLQAKISFHRIILSFVKPGKRESLTSPLPWGRSVLEHPAQRRDSRPGLRTICLANRSSPPTVVRPVSLVILKFRSFFRKKQQFALRILHPVHQVDFGETSNCISKSKNAILRRGPCFRASSAIPPNTMQRYYIYFAQSDLERLRAKYTMSAQTF